MDAAAAGAGLGICLGGLVGLGLDGLDHLARRLPRWAVLLVWLVLGVLGGAWLANALGAWERLDSPYRRLAQITLAASFLGGAGLGLGAGLLSSARGAGPWPLRGLGWRSAVVAALGLGAAVLMHLDRTRFVGVYPDAHLALRAVGAWALAAALRLGAGRPWLTGRAQWAAAGLAALASAGAFVGLHSNAPKTLAALARQPMTELALDTLRAWTDVDGDGLSSLLGGGDRAAFDPDVSDFEGDLEADPTLAAKAPSAATAPSPVSVVLITVDTLRPDHLSAYGYKRRTTPRLERWAKDALRFDRAYTTGAWTSLAISSLMRGVYPRRLQWTRLAETTRFRLVRVNEMGALQEGERLKLMFGLPLADPRPPLAQRLKDRGMHTMAAVDDGYSSFFAKGLGADRGFDRYRLVDKLPRKQRTDKGTTRLALDALKARPKDTPFFMWVHYFGPHSPSSRLVKKWAYGRGVVNEYDHEIRYNDVHLGRLLSRLTQISRDEPLLVILTSDHGEVFHEKRRLHGTGLQEPMVRVPLFIRGPGFQPGTTDRLVSLTDLAPTILAATRTPTGQTLDGTDLAALLAKPPERRVLFTETWRFNRHKRAVRDMVGAFDGQQMLVRDRVRNVTWLFDQDDTAQTQTNRFEPGAARHLQAAMQRYLAQTRGGKVDLRD